MKRRRANGGDRGNPPAGSRAQSQRHGFRRYRSARSMPLLHARDAAEAKVASIGRVNPRPPGWLNSVAQCVKRPVARALDWHVREQVEFNRAVMDVRTGDHRSFDRVQPRCSRPSWQRTRKDIATHWLEWRDGMGAEANRHRDSILAQHRRVAGLLPTSRHADGCQLSRTGESAARRL